VFGSASASYTSRGLTNKYGNPGGAEVPGARQSGKRLPRTSGLLIYLFAHQSGPVHRANRALSDCWEEGEAARVTLELHGLAVMVGYS
jgi:hypothetical protein